MDHEIRGWNECLITYVLAAARPRYAIDPTSITAALPPAAISSTARPITASSCRSGVPYGGPLFFAHYSFCGLDPRGLKDRYADYWEQNLQPCAHQPRPLRANPHRYAATARTAGV